MGIVKGDRNAGGAIVGHFDRRVAIGAAAHVGDAQSRCGVVLKTRREAGDVVGVAPIVQAIQVFAKHVHNTVGTRAADHCHRIGIVRKDGGVGVRK